MYSKLELNQTSTSANFVLVQKDGNKEIARDVLYYNLDMVISVGYRKIQMDRRWPFIY